MEGDARIIMNGLVKIEDNKILVSKETIEKIKEFQKTKLKMDLMEKELKKELKNAMEKCGIKRFVGEGIYADITQVKGRETIDTKRLKAELPEIAEAYTNVGEPTERFTFKVADE